jgi:uncharacterized membrane protein YphA (DoxX/SURF4 family)
LAGIVIFIFVVLRLFSTFADGAPGLGLLLLRVVAAIATVIHATIAVRGGLSHGQTVLWVLTGVLGLLFLVGLWTPVAGTLLAVFASCIAILYPADALSWILLGGLSAALALLGPGAWSVDARLFGWKRIELPDRKS